MAVRAFEPDRGIHAKSVPDDGPLYSWMEIQHVADKLYDRLHSPLIIDTPTSELIAFSSQDESVDPVRRGCILHRRTTADMLAIMNRPDIVAHLGRPSVPFRIEPMPHLGFSGRVAVPVYVEGKLVCCVWLIEGARRFGQQEMAILTEATEELSRRLRGSMRLADSGGVAADGTFMHTLLHESLDDGRARLQARKLGIELPSQFRILKLRRENAGPEPRADDDEVLRRARMLASQAGLVLLFERETPGSITLLIGQMDSASTLPPTFCDWLLEECARLKLPVAVGISSVYQQLCRAPEAAREAARCLRTFRLVGGSTVASPETVGLLQFLPLLLEWYKSYGATEGVHGIVRRLLHEQQHGQVHFPVLETLLALLDRGGDATLAAQDLHLHRNTLHYRLERVARVAGVDLSDGWALLPVHLELTLRRLLHLQ